MVLVSRSDQRCSGAVAFHHLASCFHKKKKANRQSRNQPHTSRTTRKGREREKKVWGRGERNKSNFSPQKKKKKEYPLERSTPSPAADYAGRVYVSWSSLIRRSNRQKNNKNKLGKIIIIRNPTTENARCGVQKGVIYVRHGRAFRMGIGSFFCDAVVSGLCVALEREREMWRCRQTLNLTSSLGLVIHRRQVHLPHRWNPLPGSFANLRLLLEARNPVSGKEYSRFRKPRTYYYYGWWLGGFTFFRSGVFHRPGGWWGIRGGVDI